MKRPYREGDWFGVPLGDGRFAFGLVTHGTRKAISGSFFGPDGEPLWSGRFSDKALSEWRWPLLGRRRRFLRAEWPARRGSRADDPRTLERRLAALVRGECWEGERYAVRDLRAPLEADVLAALPAQAVLEWREPLPPQDLALMERHVAATGTTRVRMYARAASQAGAAASWETISHLALEAAHVPAQLPAFPSVRELTLDGMPPHMETLLGAFPHLQVLRVRARGAAVDARVFGAAAQLQVLDVHGSAIANAGALAEMPALRSLDLRHANVDDAGALLQLPLDALRLTRVARLRSLAGLCENATLRVLSLGGLLELDELLPLAALPRLESLELCGLWQFAVGDIAFVESMPLLQRLVVDIGGRRKNLEIYRRRPFAFPLPFGSG